jgi:cbb3-type cytochrome oxidase subunit 1
LYGCFTPPKAAAYNEENAVKIEFFCFVAAALAALTGMGLGMYMGLSHNFALAPAHAHINLLGWVTMAIFGIYYALNPVQATSRIARLQYFVYTLGILVMAPSLFLFLTGNTAMEPLVAISSLVTFSGVLLFAFILFTRKA